MLMCELVGRDEMINQFSKELGISLHLGFLVIAAVPTVPFARTHTRCKLLQCCCSRCELFITRSLEGPSDRGIVEGANSCKLDKSHRLRWE